MIPVEDHHLFWDGDPTRFDDAEAWPPEPTDARWREIRRSMVRRVIDWRWA